MPSDEEINDKAIIIIQTYKDDCLYYVAEKIANSENIRDTILWNQVFRTISNTQKPRETPTYLN